MAERQGFVEGKNNKFLILSEMNVSNILGKTYRFDCLSLSFYSFPYSLKLRLFSYLSYHLEVGGEGRKALNDPANFGVISNSKV
jgi:hypothetical protein